MRNFSRLEAVSLIYAKSTSNLMRARGALEDVGLRVSGRNGSLVRTFSRLEAVSMIHAKSTSNPSKARSAL